MMTARIWSAALGCVLLLGRLAAAAGEAASCPPASAADAMLGPPGGTCPAVESAGPIGVVEGDEGALQRALNLVHRNRGDYVAVLFYASWCPFSKLCQPNFNTMSSMFPSIRHFAFEESVIRPSILSSDVTGSLLKSEFHLLGCHVAPIVTAIRFGYNTSRGPQIIGVRIRQGYTGVMPASLNLVSVDGINDQLDATDPTRGIEPENCPFSWARSPEKLLQQDTYLALASTFVLIRLLYILLPKLNACVKRAWRRHMMSFGDLSLAYLQQARQGLYRLNLCKSRNLQEGAMNATAWASTSLASVTMGEPSSGRAQSAIESR